MEHSDDFKGQFTIDPPLTEIGLIDIFEDWHNGDCEQYKGLSVDGYCQWIIKKDSDKKRTIIAWDGGEKFYDPDKWIIEMAKLLGQYGHKVNGTVEWQAEDDIEDLKKIQVVDNKVSIIKVIDMSIVECPECGHKFRTKKA